MNSRKEIEFLSIADVGLSLRATLETEPRLVAFSADGETLAMVEKSSEHLSVWRLKQWPERSEWRLAHLMDESLRQENYDLLEDLVLQLAADPECFPWAANTSKVGYLFSQFLHRRTLEGDEKSRQSALERWHQKQPESVAARLARVWQLIEAAWAARGSGFAATVSQEGWNQFYRLLGEAREILLPMMENKDVPLEAYFQLLVIAKGEQWEETAVVPFVDELLQREPAYVRAHVARVEMLMPRWGGEVPDSEAYARRVADKIGGENGNILYARLASGLQCYYPATTFFDETLFDPQRVFRGLELLSQRTPPDWHAANVGLLFSFGLEDKQQGQRFSKVLLQSNEPVWSQSCWRNEQSFMQVTRWAWNDDEVPQGVQAPVPAAGRK